MSDCQRLLEALSDGKEHSASELYGLHMIVHSRISDLRKRGLTIVVRREKGVRGAPGVFYRLVPPEPEKVLSQDFLDAMAADAQYVLGEGKAA